MKETEQAILVALRELEAAVSALRTVKPAPDLGPRLARLQELTRALPPGTDPTLLHYLHKQSWEKARRFLEENDAANAAGNCGHV
ncbi:MAG TPA: hypothetical protein VMB21_02470 [Candidatus Limnocylindria bacterium]|jgi:hypothetical protein|nr:hypothetical protein [Candidatus Limnocylindria bacterium]